MTALHFYAALPVPLQHLATAAYGAHMRYVRHGRTFKRTRTLLSASEKFTPTKLLELQTSALVRLVQHALRTTRFYPELFRSLDLADDAIRSIDDLRRLPLLEKHTLLERSEDLRASGVSARLYYTSGTSGTTLAVPIDDASRQKNYAFFARALAWAGVEHGRSATFAGRTLISSRDLTPSTLWRWNPALRNRLYSSYHISPANARGYSQALENWAPDYVDSYPSAISALASLFREQSLPAPRLRAVITSSETLLEEQRALIESVFGAPCFDQYGCTEQAVYISQCERGTYHVHPEYGIVEILDSDGNPVKPGEAGELVCTSFTNSALPLIRYRIGDVAVMDDAGCGCGRAFPVVRQLLGRVDDLIVTGDGRRIGRLDPVFKGRRAIREAQIIQHDPKRLTVKLVPTAAYTQRDGEGVIRELHARVGAEMAIDLEIVSSIERTAAGKFRAVINQSRTSRS